MASTYLIIDYDAEDEREADPTGPSRANIFAAAAYINLLFSANGSSFAVIGGFAIICLGSERNTQDIDVLMEAKMARSWSVITPQLRYVGRILSRR